MTREAVLLLGGGFIGMALARRLSAAGRSVHIVSRHGAAPPIARVSFHQGALDDAILLRKLLPVCGTVVHLASETTPSHSAHRPALEAEMIRATLVLLEWLPSFAPVHLIFLSSGGTLYGNAAAIPVAEETFPAPLSYHGAGKAAIEAFLHAFRASERPVTVLRPANAYGPEQPLRGGFGFIRTLLAHLQAGTVLDIWGDGEAVRDFVYVDDVAAACVLFVDRPQDNGVYNVGSGEGYCINAIVRLAAEVCGQEPQLRYQPARVGDVRQIVLDISRLQMVTGWTPQIGLAEGIRRTWTWLQGQS